MGREAQRLVSQIVRLELLQVLAVVWLGLGLAWTAYRLTLVEEHVETLSAPAGQLIYDVRAEAWVCNGCDPQLFREALGFPPQQETLDARRPQPEPQP